MFGTGGDPVATGFVSSLARPEGNLTGVSYLVADLGIKRFDLMSQLLPQARIALLVNPQNANTERGVREIRDAAQPRGLAVMVVPRHEPGRGGSGVRNDGSPGLRRRGDPGRSLHP